MSDDLKDATEKVTRPNLDGEITAWFGLGGAWFAGNPSTCAELKGDRHFWRGDGDVCACGEMARPRGAGWPKKVKG